MKAFLYFIKKIYFSGIGVAVLLMYWALFHFLPALFDENRLKETMRFFSEEKYKSLCANLFLYLFCLVGILGSVYCIFKSVRSMMKKDLKTLINQAESDAKVLNERYRRL